MNASRQALSSSAMFMLLLLGSLAPLGLHAPPRNDAF